jgi:hypothetical protein
MLSFLMDSDDDSEDDPCNTDLDSRLEKELSAYLAQPLASGNADPLTFWKMSVVTYPILSAISRRILSIPATSVPCERLFSTAGVVVNDLRSSLSPDSVNMLLFLNKNVDL